MRPRSRSRARVCHVARSLAYVCFCSATRGGGDDDDDDDDEDDEGDVPVASTGGARLPLNERPCLHFVF